MKHIQTETETMRIADILRAIREKFQISKLELAQLIGASLLAVERWERSETLISHKQRKAILELFEKSKRGGVLRKRSLVLQNGLFASRGATRQALRTHQSDLFLNPPTIHFNKTPSASVLSALKNRNAFSNAEESLAKILKSRSQPVITAPDAAGLEMSAGKNTYTYDAHTYHTKVPPQGIVEFIENYLPEGGVVLDPFAGSGMTGVAARIAGADVILNELSPAACFIGHNFTESVPPVDFGEMIKAVLKKNEETRKRLYTTECRECGKDTEILYTVWSYHALCPHCNTEFLIWDHCRKYGRSVREHKILKEFSCPHCDILVKKRQLSRTTAAPVFLSYKCCGKSQIEHPLNQVDIERIKKIDKGGYLQRGYYPTANLADGINLRQPIKHGLDLVDKFYTRRNLSAMSNLWREIHRISDTQLSSIAAFVFTSLYQRVTRLSEFRFWGGSGNTARFNVPFIFNEANVFVTFERKAASILDHLETTAINYKGEKAVFCNSATDLNYLPDCSVDFIFTDPPFGANINYSEMNILWESWLGEFTDNTDEAIVNRIQGKDTEDYKALMLKCLCECYRVLRTGHWMLLVFMNSSGKIWDALREAVKEAGFVTERLDIFDKQHGTFKHFVSGNTAGYDLVLHCRKPLSSKRVNADLEPLSSIESVSLFMNGRGNVVPMTEFLHVSRDSEPDLRRLYSEWLTYALPKEHEIVDFSVFCSLIERLAVKWLN